MSTGDRKEAAGGFPAGHVFRKRLASYEELQCEAARWNLHPTQLSAGNYTGVLEACHTRRVQLAKADHGCGTRIEGMVPEGTLVFCLASPLASTVQFRGLRVGPSDMIVQGENDGMDFSFSGPIRIFSVAVDRGLLERKAACLWQADPLLVAGGCGVFHDRGGAGRVRRHLGMCLDRGLAAAGLLGQSVTGAAFEEVMIDGILAEMREPRSPESAPARWRIARRASAFLQDRCREELRISDVCQAVGASRRTLHLGFLELYGVGPMAYLRMLRLNGVRRELRGAGRSAASITSVATRWGFTHLSRFSEVYRAQFGALPSQDMRPAVLRK
jgi:AraC family ethanolamine operon transcriptional activator